MTRPAIDLRTELRDTLTLAWPIVLNQVGHMMMGLVDTMVAGRIGTNAQAGLGLGANFFFTFTSVCMGCLLALDTYFSQAVGARDESGLRRDLGQAFWTCGVVVVVSGLGILAGSILYFALTPASPAQAAFGQYVQTISWALPSLFVYFVLQRYWQAQRRVIAFAAITIGANVVNLAACLGFGLGHWGLPRWEVKGVALATVITRYSMLAAAIAYTLWRLRPRQVRLPPLDSVVQMRFFRLGLPAAGHTALEVGAFIVATFVVSALGPVPLAAHHVSLVMAAFTFMFPLGFSAAAAVRVGTFVGAGEPARARMAGWVCIGLAVAVMSLFALGYLCFPRLLLGCFSQDAAVIGLGVKILAVVALFQIADGVQVSTTGALRGLGNTRAAMVANLIGHYPIGLAVGLVLCFGFHWGTVGMWVGLAAGLISVAALVLRAWAQESRKTAVRRTF